MNRELLLLADALAREKNVDKEIVFEALEQALAQAARKGAEQGIVVRATIDRNTGEYHCYRQWRIVDEAFEEYIQGETLDMEEAEDYGPQYKVGDIIEQELEGVSFGRISAQAAKQVVLQKIRDAERLQLYQEYLARKDTLVSGVVKRLERNQYIVEIGKVEAVLAREHLIPKENLRIGDRVRALLYRIDHLPRGPKLFLSRTQPEFLIRLFEMEVPEIEGGLLEIKGVARDPGIRSKIAVKANDMRLDPVGTCVGVRRSRITPIMEELGGERVDIIVWSHDPVQYVINSLAPAEIQSIVVDEERRSMDVVVDEENLAIAIGRSGQNVRLAADLTSWNIDILSVTEAARKNQDERQTTVNYFTGTLGVDEAVANILVEAGFTDLEEVAYVPLSELLELEGLTEEQVHSMRNIARDALSKLASEQERQTQSLLAELNGLSISVDLVKCLVEHGVHTRDDLADLAVDDVIEITGIDVESAKGLILKARAHWFNEAPEAVSAQV
ncbi:MAG: transcription termination factor NusA [Pseudomonadota bacterium]